VLDVDASETTFEVLYANPDLSGLRPADWSTDGRWIAAVAQRARTHEVAIIGAHDGSYRALKTVGWRGPGAMFFSPDGRYLAYDVPSDESALQHDVFVTAVDGSSEAQLAHAATERIMGWSPDGRQLLFTSDRNTTVGLWSQPMTEGKPVGQAVLLKPDVGTITSLGTGPSGELFAVKDASTLSLHVAPVDFEKGELAGPPVIESVRSQFPRWSPDGRQLGYSFTAANGQKAIVLKTVDGGRREIRPDVVGYLRGPEWLPDGQTLVVYGRDPQGRAGLFEVDIATGRTTLFALAGIIIDAVLSADGKSVYQLERGPSAELPYKLVAHDLATGAIRDLGDLSRDDRGAGRNMSPDDRWVARTRLIDGKWTVSVSPFPKGTRRVVHTFERQHDDEELWFGNWMADGSSVVVFRRVPGMAGRETWVVPIDGRAPRRMNIDMSEWTARYESIQFDPHGRYLTFSTGDVKQEIVRIDSRLQR